MILAVYTKSILLFKKKKHEHMALCMDILMSVCIHIIKLKQKKKKRNMKPIMESFYCTYFLCTNRSLPFIIKGFMFVL